MQRGVRPREEELLLRALRAAVPEIHEVAQAALWVARKVAQRLVDDPGHHRAQHPVLKFHVRALLKSVFRPYYIRPMPAAV